MIGPRKKQGLSLDLEDKVYKMSLQHIVTSDGKML